MMALGDKEGGPLNPEQIYDLVAFIRSWEKEAPKLKEESFQKKRPFFTQEEASYVGSKSCIECHESINKAHIETWRDSPMAKRAFFHVLSEKDKTKCTPCQATRFDSEKKTFTEENVGCEAVTALEKSIRI